jgi:hypothetical protein
MSFGGQWGGTTWGTTLWGGGTSGGTAGAISLDHGILYPALRKAGVTIGPGRTPSSAQFQDALDEVNRLIDSLDTDRLFIYSRDTAQLPLSGAKSYTIGTSTDPNVIPDFNGPRPEFIESANAVSNTTPPVRYPLAVVDDLEWAAISVQDVGNSIPEVLYCDRAYPIATLYLYPQPIAGYLLELFAWHLVPQFLSAQDTVVLPPGYLDAIVLNLAIRLAPHFQRPVDADVRLQARESLMRLMSLNAPKPIADTSGLSCGCGFDIYRG